MKARGICLLGATGSVGASTLDLIARHPRRFRLVAATARRNVTRLAEICVAHQPQLAVIAEPALAPELRRALATGAPDTAVLAGAEGLEEAAKLKAADSVMAAIVGAAGLPPTLAAARAGKRVLLANKEALVMAGSVFMTAVRESGAELLPVDSEHNAVFQCLKSGGENPVRIVLTASGGPFRKRDPGSLHRVSPEEACNHPTWDMGRKISVDSATLMNKGLEVIEAHWLFGLAPDQVEVVIHPQSIVHSLVAYEDGSVLAQLADPDMRVPIAHVLGYPERISSGAKALDLVNSGPLEFEAPDTRRFPCLALARDALAAAGTAPAALNAANEEAVAAFLDRRLAFTGIAEVIKTVLCAWSGTEANDLEAVLAADATAREMARQAISGKPKLDK